MRLQAGISCAQVVLPPSVRDLCHKLAELGWLYQKVRHFIDSKTRDKSQGLVCQVCRCTGRLAFSYTSLISLLPSSFPLPSPSLPP